MKEFFVIKGENTGYYGGRNKYYEHDWVMLPYAVRFTSYDEARYELAERLDASYVYEDEERPHVFPSGYYHIEKYFYIED